MTAVSVRSPPPPPPVSFVDWGPEEQADSDAETAVAAPIAPVYFRKVRRCTVPPAESSIGGSGDRGLGGSGVGVPRPASGVSRDHRSGPGAGQESAHEWRSRQRSAQWRSEM